MVLESLNPIENDKPLKKIFFLIYGVVPPPQPPPFLGFYGVLEGPQTTQKKI